jgi:CTP synthase
MMDLKPFLSDELLFPWEQYIVPPLEQDLLNGDLLRLKDGDPMVASSYRAVLSPSCDLVRHDGKPKIGEILVGQCVALASFFTAARLRKADGRETLKKQLLTMLTQAQTNGYCLLPAYPGLWPDMAIKLREIGFIAFSDVFGEEGKERFLRIASVDSPFREQISWAHMQIASRPGLPDRQLENWADSILTQVGVK